MQITWFIDKCSKSAVELEEYLELRIISLRDGDKAANTSHK